METTNALPEFKHKFLHWSDEVHVIMFWGFMPSKMAIELRWERSLCRTNRHSCQ
jgi:hypothetical protein